MTGNAELLVERTFREVRLPLRVKRIAPLHDRMPVIMAPNHYGWWLKDDDGRSESHKMALGHPLEEPVKIYPVSDLVNSPKTDDARCIESVWIDRDFFERQWWGDEGKG